MAVTVTDVMEYLTQVPDTKENRDKLAKVLSRAEAIANDYITTKLGPMFTGFGDYPTAAAKVLYSNGGTTLQLPPHNIGSVTQVGWLGSTMGNWVEDEYTGNLELVTLPLVGASGNQLLNWGYYTYEVTAEWGFGPAPASVDQVHLELAVNLWRGRDRGMWTEVIGDAGSGLRFTGGLTSQQRMVLDAVVQKYKPYTMSAQVRTQWNSKMPRES